MWEFDDVGCSANDRRWKCLVRLSEKLSKGEIELDQLVREVEKKKSADIVACHHHLHHHGTSIRKNKNVVVPPVEVETRGRIGKKSGLKITFKTNPGKVSKAVSWKVTIKKPCDEALETSIEGESLKNLEYRNPLSKGKRRRRQFENDENESQREAKKRSEIMSIFKDPGPALPEAFKNYILDSEGCAESAVMVIKKDLYRTDVNPNHGRLSIPHSKVANKFLESSEVDRLDSGPSAGIPVNLVQPCLEECEMSLRNWKSNSMYALVADWNEVRRRNGLRQGTTIQLWSFRRNSALCFALVL